MLLRQAPYQLSCLPRLCPPSVSLNSATPIKFYMAYFCLVFRPHFEGVLFIIFLKTILFIHTIHPNPTHLQSPRISIFLFYRWRNRGSSKVEWLSQGHIMNMKQRHNCSLADWLLITAPMATFIIVLARIFRICGRIVLSVEHALTHSANS